MENRLRELMSNSHVYCFNLNKLNFELILTIAGQHEDVELINLEKLEDILNSLDKSNPSFLILDSNTSAAEINSHKDIFNKLLIGTKLFWFTSPKVDREIFETSKIAGIFNQIELLPSESSLLRKSSSIYDFITSSVPLKISKEDALVPVEITYLNNLSKSPCDIFLSLSNKKYIKIINNGDSFQVNDIINKYANKNINAFYIPFGFLSQFKDLVLKNLFSANDIDEPITHQIKVTDSVLAIARDFGVSDYLIEGINETFSEIDREFNTNVKLKHFLHQIGNSKNTQIGTHSYLTAVFVSLIGQKFPWFNREVKKNLLIVAILHDLEIIGTGLEDYEFKNIHEINKLNPKERDLVKNHPLHLSAKLAKLDVIPSDVVNIISKHHEGAGPESYPLGLHSPQLSPPNSLFNIAHQFAIELSKEGRNSDITDQVITNVRAHYSGNSFKPFIDIMEKIAVGN